MNEILLTIILTILVYQLIVTLVCIFTNENETLTMRVSMGIWVLIASFVGWIWKKVVLFSSRKYNCYQFYGEVSKSKRDNKADKCITCYYMTEKVANQFKQVPRDEIPTEDYCIRLSRTGKEFKSAPFKSDILTQDKIDNGVRGMDANFLKKFKKEI